MRRHIVSPAELKAVLLMLGWTPEHFVERAHYVGETGLSVVAVTHFLAGGVLRAEDAARIYATACGHTHELFAQMGAAAHLLGAELRLSWPDDDAVPFTLPPMESGAQVITDAHQPRDASYAARP